jgi:outer membrane protein assembly factor BamB
VTNRFVRVLLVGCLVVIAGGLSGSVGGQAADWNSPPAADFPLPGGSYANQPVAYDINDGEEIWKAQTGAGANAPVATYAVNGEQYVAVMAGGNGLYESQRGDYLWAFKLGGTVPAAPTPREPPVILPAPQYVR